MIAKALLILIFLFLFSVVVGLGASFVYKAYCDLMGLIR